MNRNGNTILHSSPAQCLAVWNRIGSGRHTPRSGRRSGLRLLRLCIRIGNTRSRGRRLLVLPWVRVRIIFVVFRI